MNDPKLPCQGEFFKSADKKFVETIIFVPFFGGDKEKLKRHINLVNQLGFDAVAFNLSFDIPYSVKQKKFGLKYLWTDEIESVLEAVWGPKIIFSFSNPTSSALLAINQVSKASNAPIKGLIADSGPFQQIYSSTYNYFKNETRFVLPLRVPLALGITLLWAPDHNKTLSQSIASLPKDFPVLSIRGWNDPLVPPVAIEAAFRGHNQIALEVLALPEGGHLDGLKNFPQEYIPRVEKFLKRLATAL